MGRRTRDNRDLPHPTPVERIELNGEHLALRFFAAAVLLVLGAGLLGYSFMRLLSPDSDGWTAIEDTGGAGITCASEFEFLYYPGRDGGSYSAERKAVTALYSSLCRQAYELFQVREGYEGVNNLYTLNHRPNEVLEVDPGLYEALSAVDRSGSRLLYLGPVYSRYNGLFSCENDGQLADYDPQLSEDVAREYREVLAFANDPEAVRLELLGDGQVRLYVSQAYLAYAEREEIEDFIDFAWMRNAFIADFLAEGLKEAGYTGGVLSSYDGFCRNLDESGDRYVLQISDYTQSGIYPAAQVGYQGSMSIVSLRDYPISQLDQYRFYQLENGEMRTFYLDPADGFCRNAVHDLAGYAPDKGCGEILLSLAEVYIADELRTEELVRLAGEGVQSVFCQDQVVRYTDPDAELSNIYSQEDRRYTAALLAP